MSRIVCISNRVSLPDLETGEIKAGGLAVGIKAALECNNGGLWFGWDGSISTGEKRKLKETSHGDLIFLTVPLTQNEYDGYYKGMANENLWPLMHQLAHCIEGKKSFYKIYRHVNQVFARMIKPNLRAGDIIWVHDYHLIPLGRELRALGVRNAIAYFNHIPMPERDFLNSEAVPGFLKLQYRELLQNLFYYDLVGFQSFRDFRNFCTFFPQDCEEPNRYKSIALKYQGRRTNFGVFPISIETAELVRKARKTALNENIFTPKDNYKALIGVERLDYTKGLPNRLEAYSKFLDLHPAYHEKIKYDQITPLTRHDIKQYKNIIDCTRNAVEKIQNKFQNENWQPINYMEECISRDELINGFWHADVALVTPLIDGQNLVAKEFLATQNPRDPGMLVLSNTAGAAEELKNLGILCVDPHNSDDMADKIARALEAPSAERMECYRKTISHLYQYDIGFWAESFLDQLALARRGDNDIATAAKFFPLDIKTEYPL